MGWFSISACRTACSPRARRISPSELDTFAAALPVAGHAARERQAGAAFDKEKLDAVAEAISRYESIAGMGYILAVPPVDESASWHSAGDSLLQTVGAGAIHPVVRLYAQIGDAYRAGDASQFNQHVAALRDSIAQGQPNATSRSAFEFVFNRLQPFSQSMTLYVLAFLLACGSWLAWNETLRRSAFYLLLLALAIHTFGMLSRMYLQERPPVTNLYSSAIFIGWGTVVVALVLERIFRDGIGAACAGAVGFITLIIAHHLAGSGDTLEMLQAVLDTNIWLATHVVAITTGYSAMFLAGIARDHLRRPRRLHPHAQFENSRLTRAHDLWRRLLRDALQLRRHRARRHLGGSIVGPLLGLGSEGKRRAPHRALVRAHFARALGRLRSAARADGHGASSATSSPACPGSA